ncbi:MAG: ABC transporter permease [Planctomycetaceae bacterium]|nr:ABC transporter permease [Planctomycetaceae bacterium]
MFAGSFALLQRSIRNDALKPRAHWARIAAVLFILVLLCVAHANDDNSLAPAGLRFFSGLSHLGTVLILLAGFGHFVTAITEEKEEGTLGLLLLANMSPVSILLGKSTARVISSWLLFAAQFPFALLALTLGGITVRQIAATYIALAMFLFMIANLALLASTCARRTVQAVVLFGFLLFLVLGSIPWLSYQLSFLSGPGLPLNDSWGAWGKELLETYNQISVTHRVDDILQIRYPGGLWSTQATFSFCVGSMAFLMSAIVFQRIVWVADISESPRWQASQTSEGRWWNVVPRVGKAPLVWKDFHFLFGGYAYWLIKLAGFAVYVSLVFWKADWFKAMTFQEPLPCIESALYVVAGFELIFACSQLFHVEQKDGTLANLMMLPHSTGSLSYSKLAGCLLAIAPTLVLAVALTLSLHSLSEIGTWFLVPETVTLVGTFLVLCHLSVLCSLYVKWGGTALAVALLVVIGFVLAPVVGSMMLLIEEAEKSAMAQVAPLYYVVAAVCGAIQVAVLMRLEAVSAN